MNCLPQCNSPARLKMETQCFTLQKNELFTAVQLTCQVKDADTVFYSLKKLKCHVEDGGPAFYTIEEWTVYGYATHLPG